MSTSAVWPTAPIAEWQIEIIDGDRSSNYPKEGDFVDSGVPFLNTTNIQDGALDLSDLRFITAEKAASLKKGKLRQGDLIMTTRGSIGRLARFNGPFPSAVINAQMLILRTDPKVTNPDFLFYVLRSDGVQSLFRGFASGSAQPQIPIRDLKCVPIMLPPFETQGRIASILGAYDDLIEVNRRRVKLLEDMARGLFEEWFVRFRFPGHETVPLLETPNGLLPEGWRWGTFGNLTDEVRVSIEPSQVDAETAYIGLEHLPRRSTTLNDRGKAVDVSSLKLRFKRGDILFGKIRPYFHKVVWAPIDGVCSTDAIVWRPRDGEAAQALAIASSDDFVAYSVKTSNGTKMPRANPQVLASYRCAIAPPSIAEQFERVAFSWMELAAKLQEANERLAGARDLLLPCLISGQLSVEAVAPMLVAAE